MGSNYFGHEQSFLGNSSSRKGKKNSSDKPKQPQRGLGVAQLEKIRLHSQLGCTYLPSVHHNPYTSNFMSQEDMRLQAAPSSSFSYSSPSSPPYGFQGHHGVVMGLQDLDRATLAYGHSQASSATRWNPGNAGHGSQHYVEPSMTRPFFEPPLRGSLNKKEGSISQNSESSSSEDVDLELRLSL